MLPPPWARISGSASRRSSRSSPASARASGSTTSALCLARPSDGNSGPGDAVGSSAAQSPRCADGSELNHPFTDTDIVAGANMLRRGSSTLGFLSVDALRVAASVLAPAVAALFNACAQVGSFPPAWALCAITPIHKSGAVEEPGNYRGIAVGTVLGKMYATLLNFRLTRWAEANNLRAAGQAGFREDHRCTDDLLILRTVIEQQRTGSHWLAVESGRRAGAAVPRDQRVCQRCGSGEVDDEAHMVFRCAALSAVRREHANLFAPWPDSLRSLMGRDQKALAAFVYACYKTWPWSRHRWRDYRPSWTTCSRTQTAGA